MKYTEFLYHIHRQGSVYVYTASGIVGLTLSMVKNGKFTGLNFFIGIAVISVVMYAIVNLAYLMIVIVERIKK